MNRLIVVTAAAVAAAVVAAYSHAGAATTRSLDLTGIPAVQRVTLDVAPKGDSAGDMGIKSGTLYRNGKRAGRYEGMCVLLPRHGSLCSFTLSLAGGQILLQSGYGPGLNDGAVVREPIVGGSGSYVGARGQGIDREQGRKDIFHLVLVR
jgi:hypothetical protein